MPVLPPLETDGNDITYFVIYQLNVIERAIKSLHDYLSRKMAETQRSRDSFIDRRALTIGSFSLCKTLFVMRQNDSRSRLECGAIGSATKRHGLTFSTLRILDCWKTTSKEEVRISSSSRLGQATPKDLVRLGSVESVATQSLP